VQLKSRINTVDRELELAAVDWLTVTAIAEIAKVAESDRVTEE